ncbi:hypothetical protein [Nocardia farcinica]|uniref:hypothetical protein n=1 Tax=Nocardia farcinica TaxID=37329 RepID=UPI0024542708|nr:hypothetical protein [Nocardia farcinica]
MGARRVAWDDSDVEYQRVREGVAGTPWTVDHELVSGVGTAVLVRRLERPPSESEEPAARVGSDNVPGDVVSENVGKQTLNCGDVFRPKSPMGTADWPGRSGQASVPSPGPDPASFGDLATVRAMGTDQTAPVIGFDTEFTYDTGGRRTIDSYQFSVFDPLDSGYRFDIVLLPLADGAVRHTDGGGSYGGPLVIADCLAVVIRESGLWRSAGLPDPRGVARRDFWVGGDYVASMSALYARHGVGVVLVGHYLPADLTAFARPRRRRGDGRFDDIMRRVTSASGGLVSLKPIRMAAISGPRGSSQRYLPLSITVRDTMGQAAAGSNSLKSLGEVCGVPKLDVGDAIEDMTGFRHDNLVDFLEYGVNDAAIVLEYSTALWGVNAVPPVTLSGGGAHALRAGIKGYLGVSSNAEFSARFQGLVSVDEGQEVSDDGLSYYAVRSQTPVDGDANQVHSAFKKSFHGGWNSCLKVGHFPTMTYDHDIQSAYPSAMAAVVDVDFENGCVEEVIKDRALSVDDFPLGFTTPLAAYVSWEFPEGVEPCLPVQVGQSIIYPRTSEGIGAAQGEGMAAVEFDSFEGAWCCGPELLLALKLGGHVDVQIGYRLRVLDRDGEPSRSMRAAVQQMVADRAAAKRIWGKGSLVELMIKVATNSCYGKLAQDVAERRGWNSWAEEMESIGGSAVTSPFHAAMITSLVRAFLLGMANQVDLLSVTTDGFITPEADVERCDAFGLAEVFRASREALVGDPSVWEVKHQQDDLTNLTTRGNVSMSPGGVLAKAGLKTPDGIERGGSIAEREWFVDTAVSRDGKILNAYTSFPSFRELSRTADRLDFGPVHRQPVVSLDFDMKRQPMLDELRADEVRGHEVAGYDTAAWETVADYSRGRDIARHIAAMRPGTTGEDRPTGTLRTVSDMKTWKRRYDSAVGRRIRTVESALVTELVAAHKEGLIAVPVLASRVQVAQKIAYLSSLGLGDFTRAQWEHMSKRDRRARVLADADLNALAEVVDGLPDW